MLPEAIESVTDRSIDELITAVAQQEPAALALLYDMYARLVYRVAAAITLSADEAEDVVQDVFVGLGASVRGFRGTGSFEGWLRRLTVRAALARVRRDRRRRHLRLVHADGAVVDAGASPLVRLEVEGMLRRLPPKLRAVVVLKELEQVTHSEIADALGISVPASKVRHHRAMRMLRRHVREEED